MCQSKMFDPPAPSDIAARRANAESRAVYYVLVPVGAVMALGVARRRPRPVSLGSEALGYRAMLEVWV